MRKYVILLLVFLLLCGQTAAIEPIQEEKGQDLDAVLADFMAKNGLHEGNFSLSYYNTVTEEAYSFNDMAFMVAASTFKLPLNMYYYEMERDGKIASDAMIPEAGVTLDVAHWESLVHSNNEYSIGMLYHLGDFRTYKTLMREAYFTMPEEKIDYIYYVDNYYCTNMMMDALKYLYANSEDFGEMIGYMKEAQPGEYFKAGVSEYEVAHKYGWYEGAVNDVGIIYTEEPFLLAVYTQDVYGESIVADAAALLTAYNVENTAPRAPETEEIPENQEKTELPNMDNAIELELEMVPQEKPEEDVPAEPELPAEPEPMPEEMPAQQSVKEPAFEWWMIAVALVVFLLGGGGTLMVFNNKHLKKMELDEETEENEESFL